MSTIRLIACIGMIVGWFLIIGITPIEFTDSIYRAITAKPKSIKDEINEATQRKKPSFLRREVMEIQHILRITGRSDMFSMVCALSLLFFAIGAAIAIMLENPFLVPVMAVGFMFLPFHYIRLTQSAFKKNIAAELETALSIITTSYIRNEDIMTAVEENVHYIQPPVNSVLREFLSRVRLINPDIEAALKDMKLKIENEVFQEWCDAVAACQSDRSLKSTLVPIVSKLSDTRIVNGELETMITEPRKEFIIMQVFVLGNIPLMRLLNQDWYHTLMHTTLGHIILAGIATVIFISTAVVIKLTQPIEYRR